ncbi:MAG: hypothetical protein BWK80_16995 [Desulfobacteraceae bacterium IS3]|nr:MAG: hypothetical protein BWK80_16995 [Desulfobacteraceae bacterium IS3]
MYKYLIFRIGERGYGIDLQSVRGICSQAGADDDSNRLGFRIPDSDFRVPVSDLSAVFANRVRDAQGIYRSIGGSRRIILAAISGNRLLALRVDRIDRVISVADEAIVPMSPIFEGICLDCFPKVLKHEGELMLAVCPESILKYCVSEIGDFYHQGENQGEKDPIELHIEAIGSEIDMEFDLPASVLGEEKTENILFRKIKQETVSDMILRISSHILEKTVSGELGIVEKIWKEKITKMQ